MAWNQASKKYRRALSTGAYNQAQTHADKIQSQQDPVSPVYVAEINEYHGHVFCNKQQQA